MFELNIWCIKLASLNNIFKYSLLACAIAMVFDGCKKSEVYSNIPFLTYKSSYLTTDANDPTQTLLGVVFSYQDGDGDIGLNTEDTLPPYNSIIGPNNVELNPYFYNLHIDYLTLQNGEFKPVIIPNRTDTFSYFIRLQNITPDGKHKAIRGDIDWKVFPPPYAGLSNTIKLRIYIYDRALNKSNTVESTVIQLP